MDNSNKIVPPHLNAEIYRTDTTGTSTQSYYDYIRLHEGTFLNAYYNNCSMFGYMINTHIIFYRWHCFNWMF